ncbi:MAG: ABC transporter ATP-binding protein [Anaerolineaceae bacterium]|nr:ABC transporter ATP-binding protein [Anaerolineaceae bacterium]
MSEEKLTAVVEKNQAASENGNHNLLKLDDLHVWFELKKFGFGHAGYVRAVDGVTFDMHSQETIAIVGESGCGKTSLMKTILGLYEPIKGSVIFQGKDLKDYSAEETRWYHGQVGYVQQDPFGALPPFMTVRRILEEPLICNGVKDEEERNQRVLKVMEEVKLSPIADYIDKYPHMLSGGQQQRVVIARAMILNPQMIVADEPVSMLDASVRVEILKLLEKIQNDLHLAVIYITHDLSTVRYFSERIFVMYAGQIVERAPVDDLINNPKHPYTVALLTATSEPDAANAHIYKEIPEGEPPSLVNPPQGCRYHPRCPKMIKGLCDVDVPPQFELGYDHLAACWLYKED